jgi:succinoglycan biosynthesis transport protein ExoP
MTNSGASGSRSRPKPAGMAVPPAEHYIQLILHRKWIIVGVFFAVTALTIAVVQALPNIYTAQTLILVDPQKVPESYVKSTVTGSIRDRLSTLSQQILSATRLQTIIDSLHLYQAEKKKLVREEIIAKMRKDITTTVVSDFGAGQDLQAFRISYSGTDPRTVAQVTSELASLFIDENLKAREQQASGTTEFIENQLEDTRKKLEEQESKLSAFRLKHIGEMPDQETSTIQIFGQLQNQLQVEGQALSAAEQKRTLLESMMTQSVPVVDLDPGDPGVGPTTPSKTANTPAGPAKRSVLSDDRAKLAELLTHYSEKWPEVQKLKKKIQQEEAMEAAAAKTVEAPAPKVPVPPPPPRQTATQAAVPAVVSPARHFNPVLQGQIEAADEEIAKHKQEIQRLSKLAASYQAKLEAIPLRQEETTALSRDYEMTKAHYAQLEGQALSAETATELELRQKSESFKVLDPAVAPEKPSKPNRPLLDTAGAMGGLFLGLVIALLPEFFGMTIIGPQDIEASGNFTILETVPVIMTQFDRVVRRRWMLLGSASAIISITAAGAFLFLHLRNQI